jgi:hypothetical protein
VKRWIIGAAKTPGLSVVALMREDGDKYIGGNLRFTSMSRVAIAAVRQGGVHRLLGLSLRASPRQQEQEMFPAVAL